jgi:methionyl-tRNA formyltransferase
MRLVFFGSPAFAVPSLEALVDAGHDVALVVSQPDRPTGRGRRPTPPPVATLARARGLPLWQTSSLRGPQAEARLRAVRPDAMALAAFAALVPAGVLELAPGGILNVHPSLLPRWRGAAPIQAALLAGDAETGVTIIRLVEALDAGPILLQAAVPIAPHDDALTLERSLARSGARLLLRALEQLAAGRLEPRPQDEAAATFSRRVERADAAIDWSAPAERIWRQVRAYRVWPQAYTTWHAQLLKILRATPEPEGRQPAGGASPQRSGRVGGERRAPGLVLAGPDFRVHTGLGVLRLDEVVLAGRRPQSGADFLRGHPTIVGDQLGLDA